MHKSDAFSQTAGKYGELYQQAAYLGGNRGLRTMTTTRQAEANRLNALKSTGPRTPAGRAVVAYNATKHGLKKNIGLPLLRNGSARIQTFMI